MKAMSVFIALILLIPCGAMAVHHTPGNTTAILFQPYQWDLGDVGDQFKDTMDDQDYDWIPVLDEIENTTPCLTPQEFKEYLWAGYGVWFISSHGGPLGLAIAAYEKTPAGETQRNADYDSWVSEGFGDCIYKAGSEHGWHISFYANCIGDEYQDVGGEVYNASCYGALYQDIAWFNAAVNEGYTDTTSLYDVEAQLFWEMKNGEHGREWRLSGKACEGVDSLKYYGDSTMVLTPTVSEICPPSGTDINGIVDGYVEFDCAMDTDVDASGIVSAYSSGWGSGVGMLQTRNAEWESDTRIAYEISSIRIGDGVGVAIQPSAATPSGQQLDGNQDPFGSDGRGPNRDAYKVGYHAAELDTNSAAGFEGSGAFVDADGLPHVWCVTDPEHGSTELSVYGDGVRLASFPAEGSPDRPHFYETTVLGGYEHYWIVETDDDPLTPDCQTRPFSIGAGPDSLDDLRRMNALVANWESEIKEPGEWNGPLPTRSETVYDYYYVSSNPDFLWYGISIRNWWNIRGFTSTTVQLSSSDPDELHALAQSVYQDAVEQGHPRMPMFVIVGEANEGLEPEKNIVGMYVPENVDGGCWWNCASDALTFDVDGDTLADLPWTRVVGYT